MHFSIPLLCTWSDFPVGKNIYFNHFLIYADNPKLVVVVGHSNHSLDCCYCWINAYWTHFLFINLVLSPIFYFIWIEHCMHHFLVCFSPLSLVAALEFAIYIYNYLNSLSNDIQVHGYHKYFTTEYFQFLTPLP